MELRHLRYFVAVAEELHFGRAARRLHIAQPPLSRQIQALEEEVGFALFDRTNRRVALTPGGAIFLESARRAFSVLELGVRDAKRASAGEVGRITIGYPLSLAYSGLTELLRAFHARSPHVEVALRELAAQMQLDALRDRSIDIGFVRALDDDPGIAHERVLREPLVVALPDNHPFGARKRIALSSLAREPFVMFPRSRGPAFFDYLMRLCHDAGFTPRIAHEAQQLDIMSLVAAGFGVAIVPESMRTVRREGLVVRPIVGSPTTDVFVAWRADDTSSVLRDFLDVVRRVGIGKMAK